MIKFDKFVNEVFWFEVLYCYCIFDLECEKFFDDLVVIVKVVCGILMVVVILIDVEW